MQVSLFECGGDGCVLCFWCDVVGEVLVLLLLGLYLFASDLQVLSVSAAHYSVCNALVTLVYVAACKRVDSAG